MTPQDAAEDSRFRQEARSFLATCEAFRVGSVGGAGLFASEVMTREELEPAVVFQRHLATNGWGAIAWPVDFGGRHATPAHEHIWCQERAQFDLPSSGPFTVALEMAGPTFLRHATPEQRHRFLPGMVAADEMWCQLFSEADAGSDLANVQTRAVLDGDEYVVTGEKIWSSGAHYCDLAIALVRTGPAASRHKGLTFLVVDMHAPGVTCSPIQQMPGGANFNVVHLDDVRVPVEWRIGREGEGWQVAMTTLSHERTAVASHSGSGLFGGIDLASVGIASVPATSRDAHVRVLAAERVVEWLGMRLIALRAADVDCSAFACLAKLARGEVDTRAADLAVGLLGPAAIAGSEPAALACRSAFLAAPAMHLAGGTDEVLKTQVAERLLGLPKEPSAARPVPS